MPTATNSLGTPPARRADDGLPWWHVRITGVARWCWAAAAFIGVGTADWRATLALAGLGLTWSVPRVRWLMLGGLATALLWHALRPLIAS